MKVIAPVVLGALILMIMTGCEDNPAEPEGITVSGETRAKIGQMIMVGFRGTELADTNSIIEDITERNIGGVILYEYDVPSHSRPRNIESPIQLQQLCADLQALDSTALLIAIDQEGGYVDRLKESYGFPPTVTAQHLGDVDNPDTTHYWAASCAATLTDMGIDLNLAPVVDLNVNPECPVIGAYERSFSADPEIVTSNASIWIENHHTLGILCAIKHFPGHGSSTTDSHLGMVDITETWSETELEPFENIIDAGICDIVMTAHVFERNIDPNYPATLSSAFIDGLLRGELGFGGVVISDDMQGAIVDEFGISTAIEKSINAGVDILIFSNNSSEYDPEIAHEAIEIIVGLIESGTITVERIEESYDRIMVLKRLFT